MKNNITAHYMVIDFDITYLFNLHLFDKFYLNEPFSKKEVDIDVFGEKRRV